MRAGVMRTGTGIGTRTLASRWRAAAVVTLLGAAGAAFGQPEGFRAAPEPAAGAGVADPAGPTVRRSRRILADFAMLDAVDPGPRGAVRLPLFDDFSPLVVADRIERRDAANYTWTGRLVGEHSGAFVLTVIEDVVMAAFWPVGGPTYEVRLGQDGHLWAIELDSAGFAECVVGPEHCVHEPGAHQPVDAGPGVAGVQALPGPGPRGACDDDGSWIDVLVPYTLTAEIVVGGPIAMQATVFGAIAATNVAYQNSGISTRLRLAHMYRTNYFESGDVGDDLARLRDTGDGFMDEAHALRDQYDADLVALIANTPSQPGVAYLMGTLSPSFADSAFSVTDVGAAVGNLTFAHEVGHNLGSNHDRDNATAGLHPYSFGHRFFSFLPNFQESRTVMAYAPGVRVPHFSNPAVLYGGAPTGIFYSLPNGADNARSINSAAETAANFRNSSDLGPPVFLTQPFDRTAQPGEVVNFSAFSSGADSVRWSRDNVDLVGDGRISGVAEPLLVIRDVRPADAGVYRLRATNVCGTSVAEAELTIDMGACPPDLAAPFGTLNFFDLSAFLGLYSGGEPGADWAQPAGLLNFFDVGTYLDAYAAGCP